MTEWTRWGTTRWHLTGPLPGLSGGPIACMTPDRPIPDDAEHTENPPEDQCCKRCLAIVARLWTQTNQSNGSLELPDLAGLSQHMPKLGPGQRRQLCRDLATHDENRATIARRYGLAKSTVTEFAHRHAKEIDEIAARLDDEFAGLWIADKGQRISAYQDDYERSLESPRADHFEHIRTRTDINKAVAEELGQLPPRATVVTMPVIHIIEGVDINALR